MKNKHLLLTMLITFACFIGGRVMAQTAKPLPYSYGFENNNLAEEGWTTSDCLSGSKITTGSKKTDTYGFNYYYSSSQSQYLISPQLSTTTYGVNVSFYYKNSSSRTEMIFKVGYSTTNYEVSSFSWDARETKAIPGADWVSYSSIFPNDAKYIAIQLLTANSYCNLYIDDFSFTEAEACPTPTDLQAISYTATTTTFEWRAMPTQSAWLIYYSTSDDTPDDEKISGDGIVAVTSNPYTLEGLIEGTSYHAWIRGNCTASDNGYSSWSSVCDFTPSREIELNLFSDAASTNSFVPFYANSAGSGIGTSYNMESQFIIPTINLGTNIIGGTINSLTFYSSYATSTTYGDAEFDVKISEVNHSSFTTEVFETISNAASYSGILSYSDGKLKITFGSPYLYKGGNLIIDIKLTKNGSNVNMNWIVKSTQNSQAIYQNKNGNITRHDYIPKTTITYVPAPKFTTSGDWNESSNWTPSGVPATTENVVINAAATIPAGYTAQADNIIIGSGSLTIADGGQLICNNNPTVTMQKTINDWENTNWYFISSPISTATTPTGLITDNLGSTATEETATYDLYLLDVTQDKEWQNYRQHNFNLTNGMGYLYASKNGTTLSFSGTIQPSNEDIVLSGLNDGFNLVGNPYTCTAYVNQPHYTLSQANDGITSSTVATAMTTPIAPLTGVIINGTSATFSKTAPNPSKGSIGIMLSKTGTRNNNTLDNAIISFNEGSQLEKFYFMEQNANLYIPQDNEEYAIVSGNAQGEIPVNFKANENGQYTITVNPEGVEMNYLHLIDNMTGADIDLLQTPSYTFNATTSDYTSRFRLVFSANNSSAENGNETFAYFNGSEWMISNMGEATLQVVDVMGRVLSTKTVNGNATINLNQTPGVYMFRLINGDSVKVQKVVVR